MKVFKKIDIKDIFKKIGFFILVVLFFYLCFSILFFLIYALFTPSDKDKAYEIVQDYRLCMKYNEGALGEWKCRDKLTKELWKPESKEVNNE